MARRRMELLSGEAILAMATVIAGVFLLAGMERFLLGAPQSAAVISAILVELANGDRGSNHLAQLSIDPKLTAAAQAKANDMAAKSYFAHVSPDGKDPWYWFKQAGYRFDYAGENLAVDFTDSADVERAWMNSPAHRENILDPHYTQIGIATAVGSFEGHQSIFVVQEFGAPAPTQAPQGIASASVPQAPTTIATASAEESTAAPASARPRKPVLAAAPSLSVQDVLGSSTQASGASPASTPSPQTPPPQSSFDIAAASPLAYSVSAPRDMLRSVYIVLALFLAFALAYTTRFEMKRHHLRHVGSVAGLVFLMAALFATASYFVFTPPMIGNAGAAAVAAALQ